MLLRLGELPVVVASSVDAAREIMKTQDLAFATRPITRTMRLVLVQGSEGFLLAPYGDDWRQLRKICTVELLSARRVQSFRAFREQEVRQLLLAVQRGGAAVNMSELISSYIADSMARAIIGSRFKDRETFFRLLEQGLKLFSRPSLPDLYPSSRLAMLVSRRPRRVKQLSSSTLAFMETIIQEHQAHKVAAGEEEDMVDVLLRVQREGRLNFTLNIKAVIAVINGYCWTALHAFSSQTEISIFYFSSRSCSWRAATRQQTRCSGPCRSW
jgi:cytochrome P450